MCVAVFQIFLVKETQRVVVHQNDTKICRETGVEGQWRDSRGEGQLGMTTRGVWAGNTPSLLSTVWQKLSYVGDMKVKQNALRSVIMSAGCVHCPTNTGQTKLPSSLGPTTDPCLTSSLSPGGSCLEALGAMAGDPRSCCMDPINCALLGGKACRSVKGAQVLCPDPGPPQSITKQGIGGDHER